MIKNGFVRMRSGSWYNLSMVTCFYLEGNDLGYRVYAEFDSRWNQDISGPLGTYEEAQMFLDSLFIS